MKWYLSPQEVVNYLSTGEIRGKQIVEPSPKLKRNEYILNHSEAFEEWLKQKFPTDGMDHWADLNIWLYRNSHRLERELHWINEGKLP